MKLSTCLKAIRTELLLSQEAMATTGICSTPAWIKLENGQRAPSEKLLGSLVDYLVANGHIKASGAKGMREELVTLKYLGDKSEFLRRVMTAHAKTLPGGEALLAPEPKGRGKKTK